MKINFREIDEWNVKIERKKKELEENIRGLFDFREKGLSFKFKIKVDIVKEKLIGLII